MSSEVKPIPAPKRVIKRKANRENVDTSKQSAPAPDAITPEAGPKIFKRNSATAKFVDSNLSNFWWALALFVACLTIFIQVLFWTPDHYNIPSTDDYRLINLAPLSEQGDITDGEARDYVVDALESVLSLSHLQPQANMSAALDEFFTATGREDFIQALEAAGDLEPLLSGRFATLAKPLSVPVIEDYRLINGRFTWVYKAPFRWQWSNVVTGENNYADIRVTIFIARESRLTNSKGMAVSAVVYRGLQ